MPDIEPIQWSTLTPNRRNALVARYVFGRKIVAWSKDRPLLLERIGKPGQHESVPAYTESMDEAWKVLQKMAERPPFDEVLALFANGLYLETGPLIPNDVPLYQFAIRRLATLTPAMICIAALRAQGHIIEIEEKQ